MDNIVFEKIWQDKNLIELKISAKSEFVSAYQSCYIQDKNLKEIADNDTRSHRCCFFVKTELGLIEQLGSALKRLIIEQQGCKIALVN